MESNGAFKAQGLSYVDKETGEVVEPAPLIYPDQNSVVDNSRKGKSFNPTSAHLLDENGQPISTEVLENENISVGQQISEWFRKIRK